MSTEARKLLSEDSRLHYQHPTQKADLLDPAKTSTWLIALLLDLVKLSPHPILLTAVYSDHGVDSMAQGHGHHPESGPGWSVDLWHADWAIVGDDKILDVLKVLPTIPYLWTVGLGGQSDQFQHRVTWPSDGKFILFLDNDSDHVHLQAGNTYGEGLR